MVVCQQPRKTQDAQCVIYRKRKVPDFDPLYLWNYSTDFYQIYIFYALYIYIYMSLHIKFEKNWVSGEQDMHFQKLPNFLHIFLLRTAFEEFLNHIKITFLWFDYFQIWHIYKVH